MTMMFGDARLPQKFWARHEVTPNAGMSPCWTWTSFKGLGPNNRTICKFGREKPTTNYRFTCDLEHGPLPAGLTCSHTCHNPLCANPEHIVYESIGDNLKRGTNMQHPRATEIFDAKRNADPVFNRTVVAYNKMKSTRNNVVPGKVTEKIISNLGFKSVVERENAYKADLAKRVKNRKPRSKKANKTA
jgi:Zinc-binding loop region of homing endonuclease